MENREIIIIENCREYNHNGQIQTLIIWDRAVTCKFEEEEYPPFGTYLCLFLDALASLVLMIVTDSLTRTLEMDSPIQPQFSSFRLRHQPVTQNGMSLK